MVDNSLRKCPYCAKMINTSENICPICFSVLETEVRENNQKLSQESENIKSLLNRNDLNLGKNHIQKIVSREKILSSDVQKEYIHYFIKIKQWIAIGMIIIGALIGLFVGNSLEFETIGIIICLFLGGLIGAIVGLNHVGSALMQSITAEQGVVTEEVLTEILSELKSGK